MIFIFGMILNMPGVITPEKYAVQADVQTWRMFIANGTQAEYCFLYIQFFSRRFHEIRIDRSEGG